MPGRRARWLRGIHQLLLFRSAIDNERAFGRYRHAIDRIESFLHCRRLKFPEGARDRRDRYFLLSRAFVIPLNGLAERAFQKVSDYAKSGFPGQCDIASAVGGQRIGVVNHKRLLCSKAGSHQKLLPMPRPQHIQADPQVSVKEPLTIESGFSRALHSHKNDGFHTPRSLKARSSTWNEVANPGLENRCGWITTGA